MKYFPFAHRQICWGRVTDGVDTEMRSQDSAQTRVRVPSECTVLVTETFVKRAGNRNVMSESSEFRTIHTSEGKPVTAPR